MQDRHEVKLEGKRRRFHYASCLIVRY